MKDTASCSNFTKDINDETPKKYSMEEIQDVQPNDKISFNHINSSAPAGIHLIKDTIHPSENHQEGTLVPHEIPSVDNPILEEKV